MIIRTSFSDNDYTEDLKNYWDRFWFKNYYSASDKYKYLDDYDSLLKYRELYIEAHDLLDKVFLDKDKLTNADIEKFIEVIRKSILAYIEKEHLDSIKYLTTSLSIDIVDRVEDKCENGEVIYYFLETKQMVIL